MPTPFTRSFAGLALAAALVVTPLAACSSDDDGDDTTTTEAVESSTTAADDTGDDTGTTEADDDSGDDTTTTEAEEEEEASGELDTTGVRDFLNEEDATLGALFDWDQGDGIIAVTYLGTQTVQLYAMEIDAATATTACETASTYVFEIDPEAAIEVYTGGYSNSTLVVSRTGESGTCAAA
jgi:hypothetical protein